VSREDFALNSSEGRGLAAFGIDRVVWPEAQLAEDVQRIVRVPEHTLRDVQVFMLFYLLTFAVGAALLVFLGADLVTGITGSIACLGNIGPGFEAVGPMANFAELHPVSRLVLTLEMWIGRLEVLTVLVLFRGEVWRSARWTA
jgi:trk system potassium uptake protein